MSCQYGFLKIVSLQLNIGKQAKGKSSYLKDVILLPTINCDTLPLKSLLSSALFIKRGAKVSSNVEAFFESILLQDTVIKENLYPITRYSYIETKVSYHKILLLISVSRYYLQDTKIR